MRDLKNLPERCRAFSCGTPSHDQLGDIFSTLDGLAGISLADVQTLSRQPPDEAFAKLDGRLARPIRQPW
ncbi:MAG: hypothetical protein HC900_12040 [Methylacidiphilales bacterium]|nr:hypothetical protein [Candidatus Methylacidiphilales bacterium]